MGQEKDFNFVLDTLKKEYANCKNVSERGIENFAQPLYEHVFVERGPLNEILDMVASFENMERVKGATIEFSRQPSIYLSFVNYFDYDEETARRLYESFLGYHEYEVFDRLTNEYGEWLTQEEIERIIEIARKAFSEESL